MLLAVTMRCEFRVKCPPLNTRESGLLSTFSFSCDEAWSSRVDPMNWVSYLQISKIYSAFIVLKECGKLTC
jgi:hypothetical protein